MSDYIFRVLMVSSVIFFSASLQAEAPAEAQVCAQCHGVEGRSSNSNWPNLAGQHKQYLINQLAAFRDGERKNPEMAPYVKDMTDQQIVALASYYSALPRESNATQGDTLVEKGRNLAGYCAACHGMTGEPVANEWPVIAGQQQAYLLSQLQAYRSGARVHSLMQAALASLSESDLKALAAYYSQLPAQ